MVRLNETNVQSPKLFIYQLGTNNWQREGEHAPGSGILHEAHHQAFNQMPNVVCHSIYPSPTQTLHGDPRVDVIHLTHAIPICEGAGPVSNYRWHSMSEQEIDKYRHELENDVYDSMAKAEKQENQDITLAIVHHTFMNTLVNRTVLRRREEEGKRDVPLVCFVHGTALKMYVNEMEGQDEYPMRFLKLMRDEKVFDSSTPDAVQLCMAISSKQIEQFCEIFPKFDSSKVMLSANGINHKIFHKIEIRLSQVLASLMTTPYSGSSKKPHFVDDETTSKFDKMIIFVGRFADWKRLDVLLKTAASYEKARNFERVCTLIVGTGPIAIQKEYQVLADTLGLTKTFFIGHQNQCTLASLYSVASVGVFPSKNEPFGMVFIECMACGCPVIGARSGGPIDFVNDKVGELIDEDDDHDVLAVRLEEAIRRSIVEDWRRRMEDNCVKLVEEKYSVSVQCERLINDAKRILKIDL